MCKDSNLIFTIYIFKRYYPEHDYDMLGIVPGTLHMQASFRGCQDPCSTGREQHGRVWAEGYWEWVGQGWVGCVLGCRAWALLHRM